MRSWFLLGLLGCLGRQICGELSDATKLAASTANTEFALDLLQKLSSGEENVFFSSYSIAAAVAMTSLGAKGNTLDEIDRAFYFDQVKNTSSDTMALHEVFKQSLTLYGTTNANYSLSAANRLFAQSNFELKQQFKNDTRDYYMAEIEQVVFGNGEAENIINRWVEQQTHDKIKELFAPNSLDSNTVLALVSAIYFKGNWQTQFDKEATSEMNFYTTPGNSRKVEMMSVTDHFNYYQDDKNVQILELPYSGKEISMIIILPQQGELQQLVSSITASTLQNWLGKLSDQKVNVMLPKFKLETKYSLAETLEQLGVKDLFSDRCDISDIFSLDGPFAISKVEHKAFVQVDEEGTEAAAATGVLAYLRTVGPRVTEFYADRPFLFYICHKYKPDSDCYILFMGILSSPDEVSSK